VQTSFLKCIVFLLLNVMQENRTQKCFLASIYF
jgi:hypothetical protein